MFSLNVKIVSPEKTLDFENCIIANLNTDEGKIGVMAGHESMFCPMKDGLLEINDQHDSSKNFFISNGIVKIINNDGKTNISIMTEEFSSLEELNSKEIKLAINELTSKIDSEIDLHYKLISERKLEIAHNKLKIIT